MIMKPQVCIKNALRKATKDKHLLEKTPRNLVKALEDVHSTTRRRKATKPRHLNEERGDPPGILGTTTRDAREEAVNFP